MDLNLADLDSEALEKLLAELGGEPIAPPPPRLPPPVRPAPVKPTAGAVKVAVDPANPMSQLIANVCGFDAASDRAIAWELSQQGDAALEQILLSQAQALNVLSSHLLIKAQAPEALRHPELFNALLGGGLKAAEASRKAIQTLNELRNPRRAQFVKKQQIAVIQNAQNLDTGATGTPALADSNLATVEALNGSTDSCWQESQQHECIEARGEMSGNEAARAATRRT